MSFDQIILWMSSIGALVGATDWILGDHMGLGTKFEEGFKQMGPMGLGMVGMYCLAPIISKGMSNVISPIAHACHFDPSVASAILAVDMGGFPLSQALCDSKTAGLYSGAILCSTLGCVISFSIPVGFNMIDKEDRPLFAKGMLLGLIPLPLGCIIGGIIGGFSIGTVVANSIPILVISLLIALGLWKIPARLTKGCMIFGRVLTSIIYVGLGCAAFENLTGITIIPGMAPIMDGMIPVCNTGIVLLGSFPMLSLLTRILSKPLDAIGHKFEVDTPSSAGVIFTLASVVPVFSMMKDMSERGVIICTAWLVGAAACFGAHLGYLAGIDHKLILPMIAGQFISGLLGLILAWFATRKMPKDEKEARG